MTTASEIVTAAMGLQPKQRAEVVHKLLLSLEPDEFDENAEGAWAEEIRRRLQGIREGRVELRDWNDALTDMRQSIRSESGK